MCCGIEHVFQPPIPKSSFPSDTWAKSLEIDRFDLLWIDLQGAELLALRGMEKCLRRDRPDLVVEVTDEFLRGVGHSSEALCDFLFDFGYRIYEIAHDGLRPIENAQAAMPPQFNALATTRPLLPAPLRMIARSSP